MMMDNPWNNIKAFSPMYDTTIGIEIQTQSGILKTNVNACVFPIDDIEPFCDTDIESALKKIAVVIPCNAEYWNITDKPKTGDIITMQDGKRYAIARCDYTADTYDIIARG